MPLVLPEVEQLIREGEEPSPAAATPPCADVEIALAKDDPARGVLRLSVQGLPWDEAQALRRPYVAYLSAILRLEEVGAERRAALNPAGVKDPAGEVLAKTEVDLELEDYRNRAVLRVLGAARAIVARGLTGYPEGELSRGQTPIPFTREATVGPDGKSHPVAGDRVLDALEEAGLTIGLASTILTVSAGGRPPTAEEQWAAARQATDAKEPARPFADTASPSIPASSPAGRRSRSPSASGSASASAAKSTAKS